jgi:hypothetical protein
MSRKITLWRAWQSDDMAQSDVFSVTRKEALSHLKDAYDINPSDLIKENDTLPRHATLRSAMLLYAMQRPRLKRFPVYSSPRFAFRFYATHLDATLDP